MNVHLQNGESKIYTAKSSAQPIGKTSDECKAEHSAEGTCNLDADCVWCECSAVPSACYSVDDASSLPASIFTCDSKKVESLEFLQ